MADLVTQPMAAAPPADPLRYGRGHDAPYESPGLVRSLLPDHARVLDVGCGVGVGAKTANEGKHNDVLCIEPDPTRAAAARALGLQVHAGVLDQAFVAGHDPFDAIVFADVLEHVPDPADMLATAKACLKPGGAIIVSIPNVAHWTVRLDLLRGHFDYADSGLMDATHLRWFTRRTLVALLAEQGFRISDFTCSAGTWLPAYQARGWRLLPGRVRRGLVLSGVRLFPPLFACQFVVKARLA